MLAGHGHAWQASGMRGATIVQILTRFAKCFVVNGLWCTAAATVLRLDLHLHKATGKSWLWRRQIWRKHHMPPAVMPKLNGGLASYLQASVADMSAATQGLCTCCLEACCCCIELAARALHKRIELHYAQRSRSGAASGGAPNY
jgi:hypothetical protein